MDIWRRIYQCHTISVLSLQRSLGLSLAPTKVGENHVSKCFFSTYMLFCVCHSHFRNRFSVISVLIND